MSGLAGGVLTSHSIDTLVSELSGRANETTWEYEDDAIGLSVVSPSADPAGVTVWTDGDRAGVVYGAITNRDELDYGDDDRLFQRLLADPVATAEAMEGEFLTVAYDSEPDHIVVVTDKLGSRSCYYITEEPFRFATSVGALTELLADPTLDEQGVSNLLLMGKMWGQRTLVEEVSMQRPATVLEVVDGERTTTRYWRPNYDPHPQEAGYFDELADRYRQAARRVVSTIPYDAGLWLSGGLDSRTTAAALVEQSPGTDFDLRAYGYDANPPTRDNPRIATAIAERLGIDYTEVPLTAETFGEDFERVIEVVDGMLQWNTTANLSPSYHIEDTPPVLMEGVQGGLIGDHLLRYHFDESRSVVETQYASEATASAATVTGLLNADVDPMAPFEAEAAATPETTHRGQVLDTHFQNYYARSGLESNRLMRDSTGSRTMQVDGDYLAWCARLPTYYRKGTFPLSQHVFTSDAGGIPYGTSIAKLELCRRISPALAKVPYERTKLAPEKPYHLHVAGFVGNVLYSRLRQKPTYANGQLQDFWIRVEDNALSGYVRDLIDDATDRSLFDADAVSDLYADHMRGANNVSMIARVTTLEKWIQDHLD